jgi:hypothetical protein
MDDPILTPRGAGGYLTATDVADLKLGITDGDARLFIDGAGAREHTLQPRRVLDRARQDLYGVVSLQRRGNANPLNHSNRGELPQEATMQDESTFPGNPPDVRAPSFWRTGVALVLALLAALLIASRAEADSRIRAGSCDIYDINKVDPIAFASHLHEHWGNPNLTQDSTGEQLKTEGETTCSSPDSDWMTSAAWFPSPRDFDAQKATIYYRDPGDIDVNPMPTGLKLLAHETIHKGDLTTMEFPNCLKTDGVGRPLLDSSDHESHAYDANARACPRSHPYRIPQISYLLHWPRNFTTSTQVSIGNDQWGPAGEHMHADYFAGNQPEFNDRLIDLCLNDVRNSVDVAHPDCGPEPRR